MIANQARSAVLAIKPIIISYPTSVSGIIVLLKNNEEILLDLAGFALQKQPEGNQFSGR